MKGFVYILRSLRDQKQYIGSTINIPKRLKEHNKGYVKSTKNRRPFILKNFIEYENITIAATMEKKFKKSHGALLRELARRDVVHR